MDFSLLQQAYITAEKNLPLSLIYYKQLYFLQTWFYNSFAIRASRYFVCKYFIWKKKHTRT